MSIGIFRHTYRYQFRLEQTIRPRLGCLYLASIVAHARAAQSTLNKISHELDAVILPHNGHGQLNLVKLQWNQLGKGGSMEPRDDSGARHSEDQLQYVRT